MHLTLPLPSQNVKPNSRAHRMAKAKSTSVQRGDAKLVALDAINWSGKPAPRWPRVRVDVELHKPGANDRMSDRDNVIASLKASIDGLQDAGLILNDSGVEWGEIGQVLGSLARERKCVLTVTPLPAMATAAEHAALGEPLYYLQNESAGYVGNSPMWWRKGGCGYTPWIDDAEKFTKADADMHIRSTRSSHRFKKWPCKKIDRLTRRTVDIQDMRK